MQDRIKYWKGIEELENTPEFAKHAHNEFPEFLPVGEGSGQETSGSGKTHRRDFLKLLGFSVAAVSLASCEAPVRKAIPYLNKPVDVEPGTANWYASTYYLNGDYNSILVKTREARPIKIEPNPTSALTPIGTSARAQAAVLSVYDNNRLRTPLLKGKEATWEQVDKEIASRLGSVSGKVAIVSSTVISPSTKQLINEFGSRFGNFEHVVYDATSSSALLSANNGVVPGYDFSKANIIVSINADFLGTWLAPVIFSKQYITNRKLSADKKDMSRHYQFETIMSLTGANADIRVPIKPSQEHAVVSALYSAITGGGAAGSVEGIDSKALANAVKDLKANSGKALVVSGSNDPSVQAMVAAINNSLGANGSTIDAATPYFVKQGNDAQMIRLINEMNNGSVGAVFFYNANPAYDHPLADKIASGLKKVGLKVTFAERLDETAALADIVAPDHNFLESWNDYEPKKGYISLAQPVLSPIFTTRQMQDSLLTWSGNSTSYYEYIRNNWRKVLTGDFNKAWEQAVHDGVLQNGSSMLAVSNTFTPATIGASNVKAAAGAIEAVLYEKVAIGSGVEANNPWLQEMADPISKATWGNYVAMPRKMAEEMKLEQGTVVKVTLANNSVIELPVLVQPGQAQGTVGIAMGYGRTTDSMPVAKGLGANAFPIATVANNSISYTSPVKIEKTNATSEIAQMQTHHTIMDRLVVQENTLAKYKENPKDVTEYIRIATHEGPAKPATISLWDDYEYKNHHWGMVIDLNSCIGCGACTISCQAENNIPVVGKAEVLMRREMHWMRIDRYYSAVEHEAKDYETMEDPAENPSVIFQPMLCQHCNHAPCETVCPVAATMHSSEGINQMAYNRCVGTRYCANNCPYKVRRFNWFAYSNNDKFDYTMNNDLAKFVLNPDVTVRGRGVMEKCSFCVQRVQLGKLEAKRENRRPKDGEIVTACAQSCPTEAIVFGDMLDKESRISKVLAHEKGERAFHVLEELNVQPNVTYLTKIRNLA
ncbi:TAT-variant-translocated molybdopterin oxidoreductase [Pontibacter sp. BT310]|uniref:TAT-variant-translocated molybdopterin oxidoreductase n=1 Tax=Pontibacter populi TaxID=890055 RepID=A0ABS6X7B5_9BACT|nr:MULTISPECIES: TAT-variant-translocated molybdopterin oxidoreductase [Pontibacter]MBJ6116929.1 TAT-variant-translocated molybdopterin oxidoreductase [Pontibacter sp. BT310]MBR0569353.1 TAT-variant-translocated molybdopterin oxidoreductase [Microvirga sp. STS03]MBW3363782.1 TAT-variant-translocated molybdopterin oxidoreductase [Pontibacter populi]